MVINPSAALCPGCGTANRCAIAQGEPAATCWCLRSATLLPAPADASASCYCTTCLQRLITKVETSHER